MKRLEHDSNTLKEVEQYFQTRARQIIADDFVWSKNIEEIEGAYVTTFYKDGENFSSIYIMEKDRSKGLYKKVLKLVKDRIVTVPDCNIESYLSKNNINYTLAGSFLETLEYKLIQDFYADNKAERSQCYLMNHIDEGIYILNKIGASEVAKKAFCVHPLVQNSEDLSKNWDKVKNLVNSEVLGLAMEYRNIANAYLSDRSINTINDITLSPIKDVNDMLIADKIQNYKDFILYHSKSHPRKEILNEYFNNWLEKLNVSDDTFNLLTSNLKSIEL